MLRRIAIVLFASVFVGCVGGEEGGDDRTGDPPRKEWREGVVPGATSVLWDRVADRPRMVAGDFPVAGAAEPAARGFLARHADLFGLARDGSDLALAATRAGVGATYLRFQHQVGGLPVFDSQVVVALAPGGGAIRAVNLAHRGPLVAPSLARDIGATMALATARVRVASPSEVRSPTVVRGIDASGPTPRLAYQVRLVARRATWDVGVDGATGAILWARDRNVSANGTGMVFDANAIASTNTLTLTDGGDAASPALNAARFTVTLPNLDTSGFLRGLYADAQPPNLGMRAQSATLNFSYDRADNRFEEVVAYYHLDRAQTRIQGLGFTDVNNRVQVAVVNDGNQDNSFYSPGTTELSFGAGGVDDAEDGDIVLHEYGHSIQDNQVPGWGNGDEGSMGEGFGDYIAGSFQNTLPPLAGHPQPADQACVGDWDAVSYDTRTPRCLRRLDEPKHYPEDAEGEVHADGEMWSAALWRARTAVGADVADRVVLEAHFLMSTNESFNDAAAAILMADQMLFAGSHIPALRRALYHHGMLRTVQPAAAFPNVVSTQTVNLGNPVDGSGFYANNLDDVQTFTLPGAQALRVHFVSIQTELNSQCFENACDNLYLFDGNGDLYQILNGSQTNVTSVQVPGDTVRLRLVTDSSAQLPGYRVDRIESMGGVVAIDAAIDAPAPPVDAAIDAPAPPIDAAIDAPPPPVDAAIDAPPPPVDAAIDAAIDAPVDAAATVDAPSSEEPEDDGGCCSTGARPDGALLLGGAALALVLRRRRARR